MAYVHSPWDIQSAFVTRKSEICGTIDYMARDLWKMDKNVIQSIRNRVELTLIEKCLLFSQSVYQSVLSMRKKCPFSMHLSVNHRNYQNNPKLSLKFWKWKWNLALKSVQLLKFTIKLELFNLYISYSCQYP